MGGSGGGGYDYRPSGTAGGDNSPEPACAELTFTTSLEQSPGGPEHRRSSVFELIQVRAGDGTLVAAVDDDGRVIGTVTENLPRLLSCMNQGWAFVAQVMTVNYGIHAVTVRAADLTAVLAARYTSATGPATGLVTLVGDGEPPAGLSIGSAALVLDGIAELRSLVRAGVSFTGMIEDGVVTIEFVEQ